MTFFIFSLGTVGGFLQSSSAFLLKMLAELPTYEGSLPREGVRTSGDKTTQDSEGSSTATLSPAELTTVKGVGHLA